MTEKRQVFKCDLCGNIIEVLHAAAGNLVCCGQPMQLQVENSVDAAQEKHVPVIAQADGKTTVKVGSVAHPMADDHYIEWIEVISGGDVICRYDLKPGDAPEAISKCTCDNITARAYCNKHGHWKS